MLIRDARTESLASPGWRPTAGAGLIAIGVAALLIETHGCSGSFPEVPKRARSAISGAGRLIEGTPTRQPTRTPRRLPTFRAKRFAPTPSPTRTPRPTPTPIPEPPALPPIEPHAAARGLAAVTVAIPLPSFTDFGALARQVEFREALTLAYRYPKAPIFLSVYVNEGDARTEKMDAKLLSEQVIVRVGRLIARRGIDAERIRGKGMGASREIGRVVIFAVDLATATTKDPG